MVCLVNIERIGFACPNSARFGSFRPENDRKRGFIEQYPPFHNRENDFNDHDFQFNGCDFQNINRENDFHNRDFENINCENG